MALVKSDFSTVALAPETTLGVAPTTGWGIFQPQRDGVQEWGPQLRATTREPLGKYATREKGAVVGRDAAVSIAHDLTKDWADLNAPLAWRVVPKHPGNTGESLFRPTAVTATGYTVASLGALPNGTLVFARGFTNAANNGLKVLAGTSTGIEIKTTGLTAETNPTNATLEVVGVQGAAGDITLNGSGNLTSTTLNFTTLGIPVGSWMKVGGATAITQFATALYNGYARVLSVAANLIAFDLRSWTPGALDAGAAKTIQLVQPRFYRNVTTDHVDYREPSLHGELELLGIGAADVAEYVYARGLNLSSFAIDAPLQDKITTTATYVGLDIADPVIAASRVAGASAARAPMAGALVQTSSGIQEVRLSTYGTDVKISTEVNNWSASIDTEVKAQFQQGADAGQRMIHARHMPMAKARSLPSTAMR